MLSTVEDQWRAFDPLSKEFKEVYIARLNQLIRDTSSTPASTVTSIRPTLVSIDRVDRSYYVVTSIRSYAVNSNQLALTATRVNADALVLRGSRIVRLTIQRTLSDPADVAQVQSEIRTWAQAIAHGASPAKP